MGNRKISSLTFDPNKITKYFMNQKPLNLTELKSLAEPFNDDFFPPSRNSIEGKDSNGNIIDPDLNLSKAAELMAPNPKTGKMPEFKRAPDIFVSSNFSLFKDAIEPDDIIQNQIGDCYFLSAIAAISESPGLIYQLFRLKNTFKEYSYYEVILFVDGEWKVVILDDWFVVIGGTTP